MQPTDPSAGATGSQALAARVRELEDALQARDDFLAIAAHELRSPLNSLALRLAMLERLADKQGDQRFTGELRRARRSAERYVRRAVVLLDVSRLRGADLVPAPTHVRLADLVDSVLDQYRDEARLQGASLSGTVAAGIEGWWDPHMVEEIVANLVGNAIKYGQGSPVVVRCTLEEGKACIEVEDRGPGINEADQQRIFAKFERLVQGERYRGGYGLGLWIVGRMVAAHGGSITIRSQAGQGSTFRVVLPLGAAPAAAGA